MEIKADGEQIVIHVETIEVKVLGDLANQLLDITSPDSEVVKNEDPLAALIGIDSQAAKPTDPISTRLFPDAYPDDPDASMEFRRFTERSLRDTTVTRAKRVLADLEGRTKLTLNPDQWQQWVGFLNSLRLALGTRLEIDQESWTEERSESDPLYQLHELYNWLTWMQETLISIGYFGEE
ncbi:MAG: DUF2017 family protein [Actinomycetales bacterium]|nr:DUF2017 family protein [Actinomycetales bacterium]